MWNISAHPYQNIKRAPTTALFSPLRPFSYSLSLSLYCSHVFLANLSCSRFLSATFCLPVTPVSLYTAERRRISRSRSSLTVRECNMSRQICRCETCKLKVQYLSLLIKLYPKQINLNKP